MDKTKDLYNSDIPIDRPGCYINHGNEIRTLKFKSEESERRIKELEERIKKLEEVVMRLENELIVTQDGGIYT